MVNTTTNSQNSDRRGGSNSTGHDGVYPAVALPTLGSSYASSSSSPYYSGGGGLTGSSRSANNLNGGPSSATNGRLSSPNTNLGLRKRDAVAILTCLLLLRLAFTPSNNAGGGGGLVQLSDSSISASMELAFYSPFQSHPPRRGKNMSERTARPVPLDVDGDGVVEAMVVPVFLKRKEVTEEKKMDLLLQAVKNKRPFAKKKVEDIVVDDAALEGWHDDGTWGLRVLNLKPLRINADSDKPEGGSMNAGPFAPRSLFLSPLLPYGSKQSDDQVITNENERRKISPDTYPIKLLSVQIPIQRTRLGEEEKSRQRHKPSTSGTSSYGKNSEIPPKDDPNFAEYDRKRHYFCGKDWHNAAQSCHKHCPGGQSSECGEGETCYADTPCDAHLDPSSESASTSKDDANNNKESNTAMALTKSGTLPGVATVWSDGSVSLHVITADISPSVSGDGPQHRPKRAKQKSLKPELELRQLWRVYPLGGNNGGGEGGPAVSGVDFDELGITYESGTIYGPASTSEGDKETKRFGDNGAILLGGRYTLQSNDDEFHPLKVSFHALDAMTGTSLWELKGNHHGDIDSTSNTTNDSKTHAPPIPIIHTTSSARRRSHLPTIDVLDPELDNENAFIEGDDVMTSEECMAHFRASVLDPEGGALPHEFWDDGEYGSIGVGRFDRGKKVGGRKWKALGKKGRNYLLNNKKGGAGGVGRGGSAAAVAGLGGIGQGRTRAAGSKGGGSVGKGASGGQSGSWQSDILHRAVPRRLIQQQKYNARHPRTGRPNVVLFHGRDGLAVLSLKNGRPVCHVSLVDHSLYADMDGDGVVDVVQVVTSPSGFERSSGVQSLIHRLAKEASQWHRLPDAPVICHALVTSGLPPREEVFTAPLCLGGPVDIRRPQHVSAAPPLLLEGSMGYGNDVVFAMNNGVVVRYDFNGREIWRKKGGLKDGTPSWDMSGNRGGHSSASFLGRVQFGSVRESHSSVSASSHRKNQHRPGSPARPILLSGEDGAALLSPASGKVLSSVVYPQRVVSQPLLADLDGDGTDDLLVTSDDAVWGYRVVVVTGRSGGFTIVVVTLLIGVALAALVNRTSYQLGQTPKRSTDA